jgi:hypothetical protein
VRIKRTATHLESDPRLVNWRRTFCTAAVAAVVAGRQVVAVDETWLWVNETVTRGWQDNYVKANSHLLREPGTKLKPGLREPSKGGRLLIVHAMDQKGLIPGALLLLRGDGKCDDYHEEFGSTMNAGRFLHWFESTLLPALDDGAVIIMDNASYHSSQSQGFPKSVDKVGDMRAWCESNDIDHHPYRLKSDLWAYLTLLRRENPTKYGRYVVSGV